MRSTVATTPRRAAHAPPHAVEQRFGEGQVAGGVGGGGMDQGDVGNERLQQTQWAER